MSQTTINPAPMCEKHRYLLVVQARYAETDPWRALEIAAQIALFQAATCDPKTWGRIGGNPGRIAELGCLACYRPDAFGEIVEAAKSHDLKRIKDLGDRWVTEGKERKP